jgi:hypothetical protein
VHRSIHSLPDDGQLYQDTQFGFEASPNALQLIIGRGGLNEGIAGSNLRVHLFDGLIVVPKLQEVLQLGVDALAAIAEHPVPQVVRWPQQPQLRQRRHGC